jgi:hypothetical protein
LRRLPGHDGHGRDDAEDHSDGNLVGGDGATWDGPVAEHERQRQC